MKKWYNPMKVSDQMRNFAKPPRLLWCHHYKNPPKHSDDFRTLPRPIASVALVVKGTAEYLTEGKSFHLEPGDILFIPVGGTYISYWGDEPSEMLCFHCDLPRDRDRRHMVQKIAGHADLFGAFSEAMRDDISELRAGELFFHALDAFWSELVTVETNIDPKIRPALDFLEVSPERECSVSELAALCHMSEPNFFSCFKRSMGRAPMEYRADLLIMNAQRMLASPEYTISEVAERLGFGSETYFRRVFKAKVGVSPREFRKNPMR